MRDRPALIVKGTEATEQDPARLMVPGARLVRSCERRSKLLRTHPMRSFHVRNTRPSRSGTALTGP